MKEKEYKRSVIIQIIASILILAIIVKGIFLEVSLRDILIMVVLVGEDILQEIKQGFYEARQNDELVDSIGKI